MTPKIIGFSARYLSPITYLSLRSPSRLETTTEIPPRLNLAFAWQETPNLGGIWGFKVVGLMLGSKKMITYDQALAAGLFMILGDSSGAWCWVHLILAEQVSG